MDLHIVQIAIGDLVPSPRNARTHDRRQVAQIKTSIVTFGFANPLLVDESNVVIAGHGRLEAAKALELDTVPAIRLAHLSEPQKRALMLADNKIAENAGWDVERLAAELEDLSALTLDFDLSATGFETAEIDLVIGAAEERERPSEVAPTPDATRPPVCRRGDLWQLGSHRVLCGDARNAPDHAALMQGDIADAGFSDPPYNVPIDGHVCGSGRIRHREFAEATGELTTEAFTAFLTEAFGLGADNSKPGAVWFACIDWRHVAEMRAAGLAAFGSWLNVCVWVKTNAGMGSLYRSQHELVFVFRKGETAHRNNIQLGRFGRNRSNLWTYPGVNSFRDDRLEELRAHPTPKPVAMVQDALLDVTARGEIVLDPFLGAGATVIAAERIGRVARGIEIDPLYVDVILRRWRDETGEEPVRASDGVSLGQIEAGLDAADATEKTDERE